MHIRESVDADLPEVLRVEREAFGYDKEAELVRDLLTDPTAEPRLSLLAFESDDEAEKPIGHILFTAARLEETEDKAVVALLAPLAVIPNSQNRGVGGTLIKHGLKQLTAVGADLVFVLGHPDYYPRYGFRPAGERGFAAPYPIPEEHAGAWMVQELRPGVIGTVRGRVRCSEMLDKPQHWRE